MEILANQLLEVYNKCDGKDLLNYCKCKDLAGVYYETNINN